MGLVDRISALLGISTYEQPPASSMSLDDEGVEKLRASFGGQLSPMPQTRLRWYLGDLEAALAEADAGLLNEPAQLWRAMKRDGVLAGILSTLTGGLVGLPKRWTGDQEIVRALEGRDGIASVFDNMCPPTELALMAGDGRALGVAIGELVPVKGRDYPVLVRRDPQWLQYRWTENRWYYLSIGGAIPITPGDGRWVLHIDGGRIAPWQNGLWFALGQSWINKQHAALHKANWESKLANPARVAVAPQGATEEQELSWFQAVMAWAENTVFGMKPGYDVKLVESNGRGYESFIATIAQSEREFIIAIAGQLVTVDGGAGFSNADIHQSIRADIIKAVADALAHTINTQIIPQFVLSRFGKDATNDEEILAVLLRSPALEWDTKPPKDLKASADATGAFGDALGKANAALSPYGLRVDAVELAGQFGIPVQPITPPADAAGEETEGGDFIEITFDETAEPENDTSDEPLTEAA
jgi:hypothetical protein